MLVIGKKLPEKLDLMRQLGEWTTAMFNSSVFWLCCLPLPEILP